MLAARLTEAANIVKNSVMKQHKASKERWDVHVRPRTFSPGDRVWVFMPKLLGLPKINQTASSINKQHKRSKKLAFRWRGPFRVIQKVDQSLYILEGPNNKRRDHLTNIKQMKPCHDWVDPNRDCTDDIAELVHNWNQQQTPIPATVLQHAPIRATVLK